MTDREVQLAIFEAIAKTYAALTGEPLQINVETESGASVAVVGPQDFSCCSAGQALAPAMTFERHPSDDDTLAAAA